jgi:hypothetical protein
MVEVLDRKALIDYEVPASHHEDKPYIKKVVLIPYGDVNTFFIFGKTGLPLMADVEPTDPSCIFSAARLMMKYRLGINEKEDTEQFRIDMLLRDPQYKFYLSVLNDYAYRSYRHYWVNEEIMVIFVHQEALPGDS